MSRCARLLLLAAAAAVASGARGAELDRTEAFIGYSERTAPPSGTPSCPWEPGFCPFWSGGLLPQRTARLRPWGGATAPSSRHPARGAARRARTCPQAARQRVPARVSRRA
jgi:hypothetical protein